eukprot:6199090-Amphidinium_carterae.1
MKALSQTNSKMLSCAGLCSLGGLSSRTHTEYGSRINKDIVSELPSTIVPKERPEHISAKRGPCDGALLEVSYRLARLKQCGLLHYKISCVCPISLLPRYIESAESYHDLYKDLKHNFMLTLSRFNCTRTSVGSIFKCVGKVIL